MPLSAAIIALSLTATALAGVPVQLPSAEEQAEWAEVFELAGLEPGEPGEGAWVVVEPGERWSATVHDSAGTEYTMLVDPPTTYAERRALAFLLASLVEPLDLPEPEPEPTPEPAPSPPAPKPPPVAPEPAPPVRPPWFYVPSPVTAPEPTVVLTSGVYSGLALRQGAAPTGQLSVHLGLDLRPPLRLGLVADLTPPADLTTLHSDRRVWTADLAGCIWWRGPQLRLGAGAGVGSRRFVDEGASAGRIRVPVLMAEGVATLPFTRILSLEPIALIRQDLVGISLLEDLEPRGELGRTSALVGIGIGADLWAR